MSDPEPTVHDPAQTRQRLEGYLGAYPGLRGRVCRILLLHLHSRGLARIEDVYHRAQRSQPWDAPAEPNRPSAQMWAAEEREQISRLVIDLASEHLTAEEVDAVVWSAHRRDEAQSLEVLARLPDVPIQLIAEKVRQYADLARRTAAVARPLKETADAPLGTRVALIRRYISSRVDYLSIAKNYLSLRDLGLILDRAVSTEKGLGTVGGKAAGMILAWAILRNAEVGPVGLPDTSFILTDVHTQFVELNGLTHLEDHKYRPIEDIRADYPAILEVFRNGEFPPRVVEGLRKDLERWGEIPLVVRSSSLLEDSFGAAFSGIYSSLFVANQGPLEERLKDLLAAIAEIYASVFAPDAIAYRRARNLLDFDERMAVMIQEVIGSRYGPYHFPVCAGVAFSRNDYRWNPRIKREDGLMRLVVGLGTHAVDRVGDYARMVPLKLPALRPEQTADDIIRVSQKQVDVVDVRGSGFATIPVPDALREMEGRELSDVVSIVSEDGRLTAPLGTSLRADPERLCLTFDRLLQRGEFPKRIREILTVLEDAYGTPVDIEFVKDGDRLHVVQCRPLGAGQRTMRMPVPDNVAAEDRIFSAHRYVNTGRVNQIDYVVLIDPRDYGRIETMERRIEVGRTVGLVNDALAGNSFILMGPGRWGTQDILLGVQVTYADICHAKALIEIARKAQGYTPEPSFGTHFFQDLIEASIHYLPLYPDEDGVDFNEDFLLREPNSLAEIVPAKAHLADVLRVIDVGRVRKGRVLKLAMDGEAQRALCFLK